MVKRSMGKERFAKREARISLGFAVLAGAAIVWLYAAAPALPHLSGILFLLASVLVLWCGCVYFWYHAGKDDDPSKRFWFTDDLTKQFWFMQVMMVILLGDDLAAAIRADSLPLAGLVLGCYLLLCLVNGVGWRKYRKMLEREAA